MNQNEYRDDPDIFIDSHFSIDLFSDHLTGTNLMPTSGQGNMYHVPIHFIQQQQQQLQQQQQQNQQLVRRVIPPLQEQKSEYRPRRVNLHQESQLHEMHLQHLAYMSNSSAVKPFSQQVQERGTRELQQMRHEKQPQNHVQPQHYQQFLNNPHRITEEPTFSSEDESDFDLAESIDNESAPGQKRRAGSLDDSCEQSFYMDEYGAPHLKTKAKNREHAKNTRMRKKNYIETLKDSVKHLAQERELTDRNRRISLTRIAEQVFIRFVIYFYYLFFLTSLFCYFKCTLRRKVLLLFFQNRSTNEQNISKWTSILDERFKLVLPVTPYRVFPVSEIFNTQRHIEGIPAVLEDTASLNAMLNSIGRKNRASSSVVRCQYFCAPEDTVMAADSYMCRWVMRTENAVECGALYECYKQGMLRATFTHQNKLLYMEQAFDVMAFMQQLRRATESLDLNIVPPHITVPSIPPANCRLRHVMNAADEKINQDAWTQLCGSHEANTNAKAAKLDDLFKSDMNSNSSDFTDESMQFQAFPAYNTCNSANKASPTNSDQDPSSSLDDFARFLDDKVPFQSLASHHDHGTNSNDDHESNSDRDSAASHAETDSSSRSFDLSLHEFLK